MNPSVVIADTSCLIVLEKIQHLYLLQNLFEEISVTPEVAAEFGMPLPKWINVTEVQNKDTLRSLSIVLDVGEAASIALALETPVPSHN